MAERNWFLGVLCQCPEAVAGHPATDDSSGTVDPVDSLDDVVARYEQHAVPTADCRLPAGGVTG